jgi:hypothetical protein
MVDLDPEQRFNYGTMIQEAGDPERALRGVLCFVTESNGRQQSNNGQAYHPDPSQRRPGWADDWSPERCQPVYDALRKSLVYVKTTDGTPLVVGNNGMSTGAAQGLNTEALTAKYGKPTDWGWGTIDQQLNLVDGINFVCRAFLGKLVVTDDSRYWYKDENTNEDRFIDLSHPAIADVLRVQRPGMSETTSSNYGADRLDLAREIITELAGTTPLPPSPDLLDWIAMTDLTPEQQAALDKFAGQIVTRFLWEPINDDKHKVLDLLWSAGTIGSVREDILKALKDRTPGSRSVFDELSYAVNAVLLPAISSAAEVATTAKDTSAATAARVDELGQKIADLVAITAELVKAAPPKVAPPKA